MEKSGEGPQIQIKGQSLLINDQEFEISLSYQTEGSSVTNDLSRQMIGSRMQEIAQAVQRLLIDEGKALSVENLSRLSIDDSQVMMISGEGLTTPAFTTAARQEYEGISQISQEILGTKVKQATVVINISRKTTESLSDSTSRSSHFVSSMSEAFRGIGSWFTTTITPENTLKTLSELLPDLKPNEGLEKTLSQDPSFLEAFSKLLNAVKQARNYNPVKPQMREAHNRHLLEFYKGLPKIQDPSVQAIVDRLKNETLRIPWLLNTIQTLLGDQYHVPNEEWVNLTKLLTENKPILEACETWAMRCEQIQQGAIEMAQSKSLTAPPTRNPELEKLYKTLCNADGIRGTRCQDLIQLIHLKTFGNPEILTSNHNLLGAIYGPESLRYKRASKTAAKSTSLASELSIPEFVAMLPQGKVMQSVTWRVTEKVDKGGDRIYKNGECIISLALPHYDLREVVIPLEMGNLPFNLTLDQCVEVFEQLETFCLSKDSQPKVDRKALPFLSETQLNELQENFERFLSLVQRQSYLALLSLNHPQLELPGVTHVDLSGNFDTKDLIARTLNFLNSHQIMDPAVRKKQANILYYGLKDREIAHRFETFLNTCETVSVDPHAIVELYLNYTKLCQDIEKYKDADLQNLADTLFKSAFGVDNAMSLIEERFRDVPSIDPGYLLDLRHLLETQPQYFIPVIDFVCSALLASVKSSELVDKETRFPRVFLIDIGRRLNHLLHTHPLSGDIGKKETLMAFFLAVFESVLPLSLQEKDSQVQKEIQAYRQFLTQCDKTNTRAMRDSARQMIRELVQWIQLDSYLHPLPTPPCGAVEPIRVSPPTNIIQRSLSYLRGTGSTRIVDVGEFFYERGFTVEEAQKKIDSLGVVQKSTTSTAPTIPSTKKREEERQLQEMKTSLTRSIEQMPLFQVSLPETDLDVKTSTTLVEIDQQFLVNLEKVDRVLKELFDQKLIPESVYKRLTEGLYHLMRIIGFKNARILEAMGGLEEKGKTLLDEMMEELEGIDLETLAGIESGTDSEDARASETSSEEAKEPEPYHKENLIKILLETYSPVYLHKYAQTMVQALKMQKELLQIIDLLKDKDAFKLALIKVLDSEAHKEEVGGLPLPVMDLSFIYPLSAHPAAILQSFQRLASQLRQPAEEDIMAKRYLECCEMELEYLRLLEVVIDTPIKAQEYHHLSRLPPTYFGLDTVQDTKVLERTCFPTRSDTGKLNPIALISSCGLQPLFQMNLRGQKLLLSPAFIVRESKASMPVIAAIAYLETHQGFVPRLLYRSQTDLNWKVAITSFISGEQILLGKGLLDQDQYPLATSSQVPFDLSIALNWLCEREGGESIVRPSATVSPESLDSLLLCIPEETSTQVPFQKREATDHFRESVTSRELFAPQGSVTDPLETAILDQRDRPNFTTAQSFLLSHSTLTPIEVYRVMSVNQNYEYVFYSSAAAFVDPTDREIWWREKEAHPVLGTIQFVGDGSRLTPFLTFAECLQCRGADIPAAIEIIHLPLQYQEQRGTLLDPQELELSRPPPPLGIVPTWAYRQNIALLKEFDAFLKSRK